MENLGFSWPGLAACSPGLLCHKVSVDVMASIIQRGNLIALQYQWKNVNNTPHSAAHAHSASLNFSKNAVCVLLDFWGFFLLCTPVQRELARHSTMLRSFTVLSSASLSKTLCLSVTASALPHLLIRVTLLSLGWFCDCCHMLACRTFPKGEIAFEGVPALGKEMQKGILCCCR